MNLFRLTLLITLLFSGIAQSAEPYITKMLADGMKQGLTIDQALAALVQKNPDLATEALSAAQQLIEQGQGGGCDECNCGSGYGEKEYPITDLDLSKPDELVEDIIERYYSGGWELMLPNHNQANLPFFFHMNAQLKALEPYLDDEDETDPAELARYIKMLQTDTLDGPIKFQISVNHSTKLKHARALYDAAKQLNIPSLPVQFAFTECSVCEGKDDDALYTVKQMRDKSSLKWVADRFFNDAEFPLVQKDEPSDYGFQYHQKTATDELLTQLEEGEDLDYDKDPKQETIDKWAAKLKSGLKSPVDLALAYNNKHIEFQEEAHALLLAAKQLGIKELPTRFSFQDEITCRATGQKRVSYSATEMFPDERVALAKERFFNLRRRLVFDDSGRTRELQNDYPFGTTFAYHMMVDTDELERYIKPEDIPKRDDIDKAKQLIIKKGIMDPVYMDFIGEKKESEYVKDSLAEIPNSNTMILAAKELNIPKLPVRIHYMTRSKRGAQSLCYGLAREAAVRAGGEKKPLGAPKTSPRNKTNSTSRS